LRFVDAVASFRAMSRALLAGRTILVTGIGRQGQVGEAVANALADEGASIIAVDLLRDAAEERAAELRARGASARAYACDLTSEGDVEQLASAIAVDHGGRLGGLVHLAGGFAMASVADGSLAVWQTQLALNLTTAALATRAFLPLIRATRGTLVFFGSAAALPGASVANMAAYVTAKSGVLTLMRAVAEEERSTGVRANALAPASIRTAANEKSMGTGARYVERDDVARMVVWLCSSQSAPLTGQVLALG
jgi:NAD(P)-dependent dehydrogenase (short-subunit alcohol dehydrogenase family)